MRISFAPSIVARLRIVFVAIALIVVVGALIGVRQLTTLNGSIRNLTVSSVDVFVDVELVERGLKNLIVLLQQVNRAGTPEELSMLGVELNEALSLLQAKISKLSLRQQTVDISDPMSRSFDQIGIASTLILEKNLAVMEHQITLDVIEAELNEDRDLILGILENELFQVEVIALNDTAPNGAASDEAFANLAQTYSRQLLRANAISTMTLELDAIVGRVRRLGNTIDIVEIGNIEAEIGLKLRSFTGLLSQIQTDDARIELARRVIDVRELIFGETGVVKTVESLVQRQEELNRFVSEQLIETETLSVLSSELIVAARTAIDEATLDVDVRTNRMIWVLSLSGLAVLMVIVNTTIVVIEQQINSRIRRLTHAVLALAGGARNVEVGVQGHDELGKMALSLEVFKSNAEELVRSNKELEKFAYIAAHDLRSPLRAIQDLTAWIKEDDDNILSTDSVEMMALLAARVERLNRLLADLLSYSRAGSEKDAWDRISIKDVVDELSDMLDPNQTFEIDFKGAIDNVTTLATPIKQILQNLITNAIKHHDRDTGHIQVSATLQSGRLKVRVEDDGPGIELKHQEKIFMLFQTLKPRDEVEGSGLGLAIIQKLVHHYGGQISVTSNPDTSRGSVFEFDLPISAGQSHLSNIAA